jgi:hypothetical protein
MCVKIWNVFVVFFEHAVVVDVTNIYNPKMHQFPENLLVE